MSSTQITTQPTQPTESTQPIIRENASLVYRSASFSAIGGFLLGYDTGVITGVLAMPNFNVYFPLTPVIKGTVVGALLAGCVIGSLSSAYFSERIGRKDTIMWSAVIFIIGALLQASSYSFAQLYIGRTVAGISIGLFSVVIPLYESEIAPKQLRGRMISFHQFAITIGIAVAFWIDYSTNLINSDLQWRIPFALSIVPATILAMGSHFILPYSPRWLIDKNRKHEAMDIISRLRTGGEVTQGVLDEFQQISEDIRYHRLYKGRGWSELTEKGPDNIRRRLALGVMLQIFQQVSGVNAILYYAPDLFKNIGYGNVQSSLLINGIGGIVNVVATIPAILFIDRVGRRPILISGAVLMCIFMGCIGGILWQHGVPIIDNGKKVIIIESAILRNAILVFVYAFLCAYAYSWGPCDYIYHAEIYPYRVRSKAMSIDIAVNWIVNTMVVQIDPIFLADAIYGPYILYACCCAIMAVVVWRQYPETKGKSLEEIDLVFSGDMIGRNHDVSIHHSASAAELLETIAVRRAERNAANPFPPQRLDSGDNVILRRLSDTDGHERQENLDSGDSGYSGKESKGKLERIKGRRVEDIDIDEVLQDEEESDLGSLRLGGSIRLLERHGSELGRFQRRPSNVVFLKQLNNKSDMTLERQNHNYVVDW